MKLSVYKSIFVDFRNENINIQRNERPVPYYYWSLLTHYLPVEGSY